MTLPLIGEFIAGVVYLLCLLGAMGVWEINPFLSVIPLDIAIVYFLFAPNLQDSCMGFFVGSCRLDRWMGKHEWVRL
jgi:hypothetical protein